MTQRSSAFLCEATSLAEKVLDMVINVDGMRGKDGEEGVKGEAEEGRMVEVGFGYYVSVREVRSMVTQQDAPQQGLGILTCESQAPEHVPVPSRVPPALPVLPQLSVRALMSSPIGCKKYRGMLGMGRIVVGLSHRSSLPLTAHDFDIRGSHGQLACIGKTL